MLVSIITCLQTDFLVIRKDSRRHHLVPLVPPDVPGQDVAAREVGGEQARLEVGVVVERTAEEAEVAGT